MKVLANYKCVHSLWFKLGVGESQKFVNLGYFSVFLNRGEWQANQKFAVVKEWSSNYAHAKFWSEWVKLKAIFGSFVSNSGVYLA